MNFPKYYAVFFCDGGKWAYYFPGLSINGLGADFEDAQKMARGSLAFTLENLIADKETIPEPTSRNKVIEIAKADVESGDISSIWCVELIEAVPDWDN